MDLIHCRKGEPTEGPPDGTNGKPCEWDGKLGKGSFGVVCKMRCVGTAGQYITMAVKYSADRLEDEFNVLSKLAHKPGIPKAYGIRSVKFSDASQNDVYFTALYMQLVEGIWQLGSSSWSIKAVSEIVKILKGMHEEKYAHNDLKPDNLAGGFGGWSPYLIDFGLATEFGHGNHGTTLPFAPLSWAPKPDLAATWTYASQWSDLEMVAWTFLAMIPHYEPASRRKRAMSMFKALCRYMATLVLAHHRDEWQDVHDKLIEFQDVKLVVSSDENVFERILDERWLDMWNAKTMVYDIVLRDIPCYRNLAREPGEPSDAVEVCTAKIAFDGTILNVQWDHEKFKVENPIFCDDEGLLVKDNRLPFVFLLSIDVFAYPDVRSLCRIVVQKGDDASTLDVKLKTICDITEKSAGLFGRAADGTILGAIDVSSMHKYYEHGVFARLDYAEVFALPRARKLGDLVLRNAYTDDFTLVGDIRSKFKLTPPMVVGGPWTSATGGTVQNVSELSGGKIWLQLATVSVYELRGEVELGQLTVGEAYENRRDFWDALNSEFLLGSKKVVGGPYAKSANGIAEVDMNNLIGHIDGRVFVLTEKVQSSTRPSSQLLIWVVACGFALVVMSVFIASCLVKRRGRKIREDDHHYELEGCISGVTSAGSLRHK